MATLTIDTINSTHDKGLQRCKQVFFHYQVGSFVDQRSSKPYTLVGPPALQLVLDPLAVKLLDNRLYLLALESWFALVMLGGVPVFWDEALLLKNKQEYKDVNYHVYFTCKIN